MHKLFRAEYHIGTWWVHWYLYSCSVLQAYAVGLYFVRRCKISTQPRLTVGEKMVGMGVQSAGGRCCRGERSRGDERVAELLLSSSDRAHCGCLSARCAAVAAPCTTCPSSMYTAACATRLPPFRLLLFFCTPLPVAWLMACPSVPCTASRDDVQRL